jgi:tRNA1(Val) A37 N6-methylase TrmN6
MDEAPEFSEGTLLDGRVIYRQPVKGYRTGIEPILLAASVPARPGERVLEAGTGAGGGLLALTARIKDISGAGLESDPAMARLAADNLAANLCAGVRIYCTDFETWQPDGEYDHAFANPPWHSEASTPSPVQARRLAKIAGGTTLGRWTLKLASALRHRGTLSLILPAASLVEATQALAAAQCAEIAIIPLWPKHGLPAKLVILQGTRNGKGRVKILPGLCLHEQDGAYTPAANRILRDGVALNLDPRGG